MSARDDYKKVRSEIERLLERDWGPRCKTRDIDDFPELKHAITGDEKFNGRCPVCLVYERFDDFWNIFAWGEDDDVEWTE